MTLFGADGSFIREFVNPSGPGDISELFILDAGDYTLVLTQFNNFAPGNLADGFLQDSDPEFTSTSSSQGLPAQEPPHAREACPPAEAIPPFRANV